MSEQGAKEAMWVCGGNPLYKGTTMVRLQARVPPRPRCIARMYTATFSFATTQRSRRPCL